MTVPQGFDKVQVLLTPLVATGTYGAEVDITSDVDISDLIKRGGISSIRKDVDFGDYDVGVFTFGNVTMRAINYDGKFNDPSDWRSIFTYRRGLAKVEIKFKDKDGNAYTQFKGIINEDGTRQDFVKGEVRFKVLSLDSIFRSTKVAGGTVSNGMSFSNAIKSILNITEITSVVNYSASNINVSYNGTIDDGNYFDNKKVKDSLDELLLVSNSILLIDSSDNIIVKSRGESATTHNIYGNGNVEGRDNILKITSYNSGVQRAFNSISVSGITVTDENLVWLYGVRKKDLTMDFITNSDTATAVATALLSEFKVPKPEMEVVLPMNDARQIDLLDKVAVDFTYRLEPPAGQETLTVTGVAVSGSAVTNKTLGNFQIHKNQIWKVIGKEDKAGDLTTKIKLREIGTGTGDGWS